MINLLINWLLYGKILELEVNRKEIDNNYRKYKKLDSIGNNRDSFKRFGYCNNIID